jgi:hypothetical protein
MSGSCRGMMPGSRNAVSISHRMLSSGKIQLQVPNAASDACQGAWPSVLAPGSLQFEKAHAMAHRDHGTVTLTGQRETPHAGARPHPKTSNAGLTFSAR